MIDGRGPPGVLDYGNCLAHGVASAEGEPLLCKGADFAKTGLMLVEY
jgi:uncharacterized protein with PIN domain